MKGKVAAVTAVDVAFHAPVVVDVVVSLVVFVAVSVAASARDRTDTNEGALLADLNQWRKKRTKMKHRKRRQSQMRKRQTKKRMQKNSKRSHSMTKSPRPSKTMVIESPTDSVDDLAERCDAPAVLKQRAQSKKAETTEKDDEQEEWERTSTNCDLVPD